MGKVNYMGGKLNTVKSRNKDSTLQIRKRHFGKQRLKTLSEYLQAINNPVPPVPTNPISGISLAHARRESRREPSSDSSTSVQRYRSYIPSPSKVSSESSDSLDAKAWHAKLRTSRIMRELSRVEPASFDYQRKRLLEIPDFAGLAERKRRMETTKQRTPAHFQACESQAASAYSNDEDDDSIMIDPHDIISEVSSLVCNISEACGESIHSWNESNIHKGRLSPISSICSFSKSSAREANSPIISERYSEPNQDLPESDIYGQGNDSEQENKWPVTEDYLTQIHTSDSVILRAENRNTKRALTRVAWDTTCDPNDIVMSDEWLAFSRLLDTTLYPSFRSKLSEVPQVMDSRKEILMRSDIALGLDFHVFPHLLSGQMPQKNSISPLKSNEDKGGSLGAVSELTNANDGATVQSEDQNTHSASNLSPLAITAQCPIDIANLPTNAYALSDFPSILLSCPPSRSESRTNSNSIECLPISDNIEIITGNTGCDDDNQYKRDSRSHWDELMEELLGPVPLPQHTTGQLFETTSNASSRISVSSSDVVKHPRQPSPFQSLRIESSDDQNVSQDIDRIYRKSEPVTLEPKHVRDSITTNETEGGMPEIISGPVLFAFTFTSDRDDD